MKLNKEDFKAFICCQDYTTSCTGCPYRDAHRDKCDYVHDMQGLWLNNIFKMILNTNETSATKCFETINKIKRGELDDE